MLNKNLLRRFNGSVKAIEAYCREHHMDVRDLNDRYVEAARRTKEPKFHKLR